MGTLISYSIMKLWGPWVLVGVCAVGALIVWLVDIFNLAEDDNTLN